MKHTTFKNHDQQSTPATQGQTAAASAACRSQQQAQPIHSSTQAASRIYLFAAFLFGKQPIGK